VRPVAAALSIGWLLAAISPALAEQQFRWTSGVGMQSCASLDDIPNATLVPWIRGYWTGANLYLGSGDLCLERASIAEISPAQIRATIEVHCSSLGDNAIMFAAFNALKGLPTLQGSRSAGC